MIVMQLKTLGPAQPAEPKPCCTPNKAAASPTLASRGGAVNTDIAATAYPVQPAITHAVAPSTDGMVRLDGATYLKGTDAPDRWATDGEQPVHPVTVRPFYLDATAVTNDAFAGLDGARVGDLAPGQGRTLRPLTWDAGTEANDEAAATVPGPAGGGVGYDPARPAGGFVHVHPGVLTQAEGLASSALTEAQRWDGAALRVTVFRLA